MTTSFLQPGYFIQNFVTDFNAGTVRIPFPKLIAGRNLVENAEPSGVDDQYIHIDVTKIPAHNLSRYLKAMAKEVVKDQGALSQVARDHRIDWQLTWPSPNVRLMVDKSATPDDIAMIGPTFIGNHKIVMNKFLGLRGLLGNGPILLEVGAPNYIATVKIDDSRVTLDKFHFKLDEAIVRQFVYEQLDSVRTPKLGFFSKLFMKSVLWMSSDSAGDTGGLSVNMDVLADVMARSALCAGTGEDPGFIRIVEREHALEDEAVVRAYMAGDEQEYLKIIRLGKKYDVFFNNPGPNPTLPIGRVGEMLIHS